MKTITKNKKIIDADNNQIIQYFDPSDTKKIVDYYKSLGKWKDISVDRSGDIILWLD